MDGDIFGKRVIGKPGTKVSGLVGTIIARYNGDEDHIIASFLPIEDEEIRGKVTLQLNIKNYPSTTVYLASGIKISPSDLMLFDDYRNEIRRAIDHTLIDMESNVYKRDGMGKKEKIDILKDMINEVVYAFISSGYCDYSKYDKYNFFKKIMMRV